MSIPVPRGRATPPGAPCGRGRAEGVGGTRGMHVPTPPKAGQEFPSVNPHRRRRSKILAVSLRNLFFWKGRGRGGPERAPPPPTVHGRSNARPFQCTTASPPTRTLKTRCPSASPLPSTQPPPPPWHPTHSYCESEAMAA